MCMEGANYESGKVLIGVVLVWSVEEGLYEGSSARSEAASRDRPPCLSWRGITAAGWDNHRGCDDPEGGRPYRITMMR